MLKSEIALDHIINPVLGTVGEPSQYCKDLLSINEVAAYEAGSVNRAGGIGYENMLNQPLGDLKIPAGAKIYVLKG